MGLTSHRCGRSRWMWCRRVSVSVSVGIAVALTCTPHRHALAYVSVLWDDSYVPRWDTSEPIPWYVDASGSDDMPLDDVIAACTQAFDAWASVSCADISFVFMGTYQGGEPHRR